MIWFICCASVTSPDNPLLLSLTEEHRPPGRVRLVAGMACWGARQFVVGASCFEAMGGQSLRASRSQSFYFITA